MDGGAQSVWRGKVAHVLLVPPTTRHSEFCCDDRAVVIVVDATFSLLPPAHADDQQPTKMPFAQLILGSPGAGKSTYCDGSTESPLTPLSCFFPRELNEASS
jgi:hypothetical protein